MPAFYRQPLSVFLADDPESIIGRLTSRAATAGYVQQLRSQTEAWADEIEILKRWGHQLISAIGEPSWHILLEYPIPRHCTEGLIPIDPARWDNSSYAPTPT